MDGRLTRRRVLAVGAGGAVAAASGARLLAGPASPRPRARRTRRRVVVVGAGLSGLAAAYELHAAGFEVVVLEARDRVGGRVHTIRFPDGQHAEAGGEFIDTIHTTIRGYVRRFGLQLDDLRRLGSDLPGAAYLDGRRGTFGGMFGSDVRRAAYSFDRRMDALGRRVSAQDPHWPALDRRSAADVMDDLRLPPLARELVTHWTIRDDYTVEPSELSALYVAQAYRATTDAPWNGIEVFRIHGGNDQLPERFARELEGSVHLSSPVTRVTATADGVRVGDVDADHCVIATPLPPLREVDFVPALPAAMADAIANLQYGIGTKTFVQYASRFWRDQGFDGDTFTDLPIGSTWEATEGQRGPGGVLLVYTMGRPGAAATALPDAARISETTRELERIYPGSRSQVRAAETVAWANEPYTGGTYTAYAPGQVTAFWRALREPVGRIHFAGEHTDAFTGYMEGALRSGVRIAHRIIRTG